MASSDHWQHLADEAWRWITDLIQQNKLTSSLIATNAALIVCYISWKSTRTRRLSDKIPGFRSYPLVGDILSLDPDPCGEFTAFSF